MRISIPRSEDYTRRLEGAVPGRTITVGARDRAMRTPHVAALATAILLTACAHGSGGSRAVAGGSPVTPAPGSVATGAGAAVAESPTVPQPAAPASVIGPEAPAATVPASAATPTAPVASSSSRSSQSSAETPKSPPSKQATGPKSTPASPVPATAATAAGGALPPSKAAAAPPLDLKGLEQRLRDTRAIGLFTKLSLKNQVDDLLAQFKAFHQGRPGVTVGQLRQTYELLLMKVVTLLQDGDPALANAVSSSREAIWEVLTDPQKFATIGYST